MCNWFEHQTKTGSSTLPLPFGSLLVSMNPLNFPSYMNDKDDKGQNETEQKPVVDEFQVSCLWQGAGDALE